MVQMSHDPAAGAIGVQLVDMAARGLSSGAAASMAVTALVPAGADEVSAQAAAAFAAEGAAMLALHTAAQEEVARTGATLTDIARMYSQVDGEAAGVLEAAGGQLVGQPFVGGSGAGGGLLRSETLPGAAGSTSRTPLLANLIEGVPVANPTPTVPGSPTTIPAAVSAASTVLGAGAVPLSSIGSMAQGASAGAGTGVASSVSDDSKERAEPGNDDRGEQLL